MDDKISKKLTHCGDTYIIAGLETIEGEEWALIDFPKTAGEFSWTKIWHHVADIVGRENIKNTGSTAMKVKSASMSAFNMAIYRYWRWMEQPNSKCLPQSFDPLIEEGQKELPLDKNDKPKDKGLFPEIK